ncbi:hypothetical protein E2C01_045777 [Portunus trituberculatus]|uniref:Uncharacterized protein n=1 Tax=Portunus trituberculatus TaxID=210409 RepID=A0A5B7FW17_PORTR|nr:hypothetical protein [Portunus trituberculatus]
MERQANDTHKQIILLIKKAHLIAAKTTKVLVLVASDDSNFLSTFAEWSLRSRFLVWTTRLLLFTRLQARTVQHLHETLSMTNSLLLAPAINNERFYVVTPKMRLSGDMSSNMGTCTNKIACATNR